jgi:hypothetical protein
MEAGKVLPDSHGMPAYLSGALKAGWFPYVAIAASVIVFNLIGIFGPHTLQHDDPANYTRVMQNAFPTWMLKHSFLSIYIEWIAWKIMAFSPFLARGLYVLCFMVPISLLFYHLLTVKFGLSRIMAASASIIPQILPAVWQIPAGVNMSYPLRGLLLFLITIVISFKYLDGTDTRKWAWFFASIAMYAMSLDSMQQSVFLFPQIIIIIAGYTRFNRRHVFLLTSFLMLFGIKLTQMVVVPRKTLSHIPLYEIGSRVVKYCNWSLPISTKDSIAFLIAVIVIIAAGMILNLKTGDANVNPGIEYRHIQKRFFILYTYSVFSVWMVSSIAVFILFSDEYTSRYVYLSAFGFWVLMALSLQAILDHLFKNRVFSIILFSFLIVCSGCFRMNSLNKFFSMQNQIQETIITTLNKQPLPPLSQVVVMGVPYFAGGWFRSSGYLQHALRRNDIEGLISYIHSSPYYNFDDHMDPEIRDWGPRYNCTGLDLERPAFLYTINNKCMKKLKNKTAKNKCNAIWQMEYALQWRGELSNASWNIYKFDMENGRSRVLVSGSGYDGYINNLKKLKRRGINQSDILWGGPPTDEERRRMGLPPGTD